MKNEPDLKEIHATPAIYINNFFVGKMEGGIRISFREEYNPGEGHYRSAVIMTDKNAQALLEVLNMILNFDPAVTGKAN